MKTRRGCLTAALAGFVCCLGATAGLPIFAIGVASPGSAPFCTPGSFAGPGGRSPTILGPSSLTQDDLVAWWDTTRGRQPQRLGAPVDDIAGWYLTEGDADGVRGDIAFAQAVHETGYFTSTDTSRNNYAGIAHPDGTRAGRHFPGPRTGVRAHIQLLKKFTAGNDTDLAHPDVAPDAAAGARTWNQLAGTWATDPSYWTAIARLYDSMLSHADSAAGPSSASDVIRCEPTSPDAGAGSANGDLVDVQGIVVDASIAAQVDAMLAAAAAEGVQLTGTGYRGTDRQIELRQAHCGTSDYAIYEMPSSQCSPPTARPGSSQHEVGLAIDFDNCSTHSTACWQWLNDNAATYGFYELVGGREPWHWSTTAT